MTLTLSRKCEYATQAVTYLARRREESRSSTWHLARTLKVPDHFLARILQRLTQKGLLTSTKGPRGGCALGKPTKEITLFHVVDAVDGVGFANRCVLGSPECSDKLPSAVNEQWAFVTPFTASWLEGAVQK